ncbi:MAG: complex I NDUFA9 subunit family protein [Alphaproteobacteria bacterium]|nr:complex I NDUFA9 subunit family protein [Alphaproteobacteria bacterium]
MSAASRRVTVFGGSGFIGRYVVKRLAARGDIVRVAVRDPSAAAFLKTMGGVGQVVTMRANVTDPAAVAEAVNGADVVVNLVGILYEAGRQRFDAVQAQAPDALAGAARAAGVGTFVQVSAIGADPGSPSAYGRTKAAGEAAVRRHYPAAPILRPSIVFGPEDDFFNRFARMAQMLPVLPLIGGGQTKFQPVYVGDVAEAVVRATEHPAAAGTTFELGGPRVATFRELLQMVLRETGRNCALVPVPFWAARMQAFFLEMLPMPLLTRDQVALLERDNVVAPGAIGLSALAIEATPMELVLPAYLEIYRRGGRYSARRFV